MSEIFYVLGGLIAGMVIMILFRKEQTELLKERLKDNPNSPLSQFSFVGRPVESLSSWNNWNGGSYVNGDDDDALEDTSPNRINQSASPYLNGRYGYKPFGTSAPKFSKLQPAFDSTIQDRKENLGIMIDKIYSFARIMDVPYSPDQYTWYINEYLIGQIINMDNDYPTKISMDYYGLPEIKGSIVVSFADRSYLNKYPVMLVRNQSPFGKARFIIGYNTLSGTAESLPFEGSQKQIIVSHEDAINGLRLLQSQSVMRNEIKAKMESITIDDYPYPYINVSNKEGENNDQKN